jgi:hypothetical protein
MTQALYAHMNNKRKKKAGCGVDKELSIIQNSLWNWQVGAGAPTVSFRGEIAW